MRKCRNCNISFSGSHERCPLCQGELYGEESERIFPEISAAKQTFFNKIFLFAIMTVAIISVCIEYYISRRIYVSRYIIFGVITTFIAVKLIQKNYSNVFRFMNRYFLFIIIALIIWYFVTMADIIPTYLFPIFLIIALIYDSLVILILRSKYVIEYMKTIIIDILFGMAPVIFILSGAVSNRIPSYICILLNVIFLLGIIVFGKDYLAVELRKIKKL